MKVKSIFVNLPVTDVVKTREFWSKLGFGFNEEFSNEQGLCLVLSEGSMYAMLISHELYATFTNRPIADKSVTQVINAIEVDTKQQVDEMIAAALSNGGSRYREAADHGWMYYDSFADPDGHQWEVMYMPVVNQLEK